VLAALAAVSLRLLAQTHGEITDEVSDPSGAVVGGPAVTVTHEQTNASRHMTSNSAGLYGFPSLVPGSVESS